MRIFLKVAFFTLVLTSTVWVPVRVAAQMGMLSSVPFWPNGGDTSQLPKGQHVFFDLHTAEYVVYYAPDPAAGQVQQTMLRFAAHSMVQPAVTFAVSSSGDGHLHYTYQVENGAYARQSIQKITMLDYSDSSPRSAGASWTAQVEPHKERDLGTSAMSASAIEWQSNSAAPSIAPGSAKQGLAVDSISLPGFVDMSFQGESKSTEYTPEAAASPPQDVREQLARLTSPSRDRSSTMVLGPRFLKGASPSAIAQNYDLGMQRLIRGHQLDPNSPFVQRARALFIEQLQAADQPLLNSHSLDFANQAKPGLETAIANALEAALAQ